MINPSRSSASIGAWRVGAVNRAQVEKRKRTKCIMVVLRPEVFGVCRLIFKDFGVFVLNSKL